MVHECRGEMFVPLLPGRCNPFIHRPDPEDEGVCPPGPGTSPSRLEPPFSFIPRKRQRKTSSLTARDNRKRVPQVSSNWTGGTDPRRSYWSVGTTCSIKGRPLRPWVSSQGLTLRPWLGKTLRINFGTRERDLYKMYRGSVVKRMFKGLRVGTG